MTKAVYSIESKI